MTEQRKLAAVMFTDIIGYTALMSKDEQKALKTLQNNRDIQKSLAEKHNGEFLKEMGDGTLLCFQSALDAVRCAMEMQQSVKDNTDLNLRIGIHLGDIVFKEGDVFGDGVNVASRIEKLAEAGGICISEQIHLLVRNQPEINAVFIDEKRLKNVDRPVKIFQIIEARSVDKRADIPIYRSGSAQKSIAVLPFLNISADPNQEYFCDGMTEEIINALTHINNLKVIARTSSFIFKDRHEDMREIGKKLDVEHLLEGSVRKAGNRLRITAQLIKVADGSHLWSEKYDRELEDIFKIQDEISLAIVDMLKLRLVDEVRNRVRKKATDNSDAFNNYLKGRFNILKLTEEGIKRGIEFYKHAIDIDPEYTIALAGLAVAYSRCGLLGILPIKEARENAKIYLDKTLSLDKEFAEVHTAEAIYRSYFLWDFENAEQEYKLALEISPGSETCIYEYMVFSVWLRPGDKGIELAKKLNELDPLSPIALGSLGWTHFTSLKFDEAIAYYKASIELNPELLLTYSSLFWCYALNNMHSDALELFNRIERQFPSEVDDLLHYSLNSHCLAVMGYEKRALEAIKNLEKLAEKRNVDPIYFAFLYAGLNKKDQAFQYLNEAYKNRSIWLIHLNQCTNLWFKNINIDPRYTELLKKMGLDKW